jgi:hypothetical protein
MFLPESGDVIVPVLTTPHMGSRLSGRTAGVRGTWLIMTHSHRSFRTHLQLARREALIAWMSPFFERNDRCPHYPRLKRYPQYDHCAVLIAEFTSRFLNVISLFNGTGDKRTLGHGQMARDDSQTAVPRVLVEIAD